MDLTSRAIFLCYDLFRSSSIGIRGQWPTTRRNDCCRRLVTDDAEACTRARSHACGDRCWRTACGYLLWLTEAPSGGHGGKDRLKAIVLRCMFGFYSVFFTAFNKCTATTLSWRIVGSFERYVFSKRVNAVCYINMGAFRRARKYTCPPWKVIAPP